MVPSYVWLVIPICRSPSRARPRTGIQARRNTERERNSEKTEKNARDMADIRKTERRFFRYQTGGTPSDLPPSIATDVPVTINDASLARYNTA